MNRSQREKFKYEAKIAIRKLFPEWFLRLIRRRQVPLNKMLTFKEAFLTRKVDDQTKTETISIIVPCYNHSKFLSETFSSIIKQTRLPDQVILIDDYSRDKTAQTIKNLITEYKKYNPENIIDFITIRNEKNLGQALTINKAIDLASTDLIMILNDDDYLMHDAIEITLNIFRQNKNLSLIGFGNINFSDPEFLINSKKMIRDYYPTGNIPLKITTPNEAILFEDYCSLNMTHTGSSFSKAKALSIGQYRQKKDRLVPFSDRDFQIRMNLIYDVGTNNELPICFWRDGNSVDSGKNS